MKNDTINHAIQAAFVADAYCLGSHWIYDAAQLKKMPIDWEEINAQKSMNHNVKKKVNVTH